MRNTTIVEMALLLTVVPIVAMLILLYCCWRRMRSDTKIQGSDSIEKQSWLKFWHEIPF